MNYEYRLKGERDLVVRDSKKRNVGEKVGVKIKTITKLEDWDEKSYYWFWLHDKC